jgi:hypothetical protein
VVAGNGESRQARELVDEISGLSELRRFRTLGQVAADDDGISAERRRNSLKRISDARQIGWAEM